MSQNKGLPLFGLILALAAVVSTYLVTDVIRDVRLSHQIIKVRGYAEKPVKSDSGSWGVSFSIQHQSLKQGYQTLQQQKERVLAFILEQGFTRQEIWTGAVSFKKYYKKNEKGYETREFDHYILSQRVGVESSKVHKINAVASKITRLVKEGIEIESGSPSYTYSKVNDLKSELLTMATEDARQRAKTLAEGSGVKLGFLRAARQGEFGVRSAYGSTVNYDSSYDDLRSIDKKITAVVTVDYSMK